MMATRTFLLLLLWPLLGLAQQFPLAESSSQQETIRISTAAVQIDVIVTDKSGRRIRDLKAADFHVLDDGRPQTVDFFATITNSREQQTTGSRNNPVAGTAGVTPITHPYSGRFIAIVFDDLSLSTENFLRSRQALRDYISNKTLRDDMVAVVSTSGGIGSLQQFTNDRRRLLAAFDRLTAQTSLTEKLRDLSLKITIDEAARIDSGDTLTLDNVVTRLAQEDRDLMPRDAIEAQVRSTAHSTVTQLNVVTRMRLSMLKQVFQGMANLPGRKIVTLLTQSLPVAGGSSSAVSNELLHLIDFARRCGVSVYAVDARGLHAGNVTASDNLTATSLWQRSTNAKATFSDFENLSAARVLAAGTGGEVIANTNDLAAGVGSPGTELEFAL